MHSRRVHIGGALLDTSKRFDWIRRRHTFNFIFEENFKYCPLHRCEPNSLSSFPEYIHQPPPPLHHWIKDVGQTTCHRHPEYDDNALPFPSRRSATHTRMHTHSLSLSQRHTHYLSPSLCLSQHLDTATYIIFCTHQRHTLATCKRPYWGTR